MTQPKSIDTVGTGRFVAALTVASGGALFALVGFLYFGGLIGTTPAISLAIAMAFACAVFAVFHDLHRKAVAAEVDQMRNLLTDAVLGAGDEGNSSQLASRDGTGSGPTLADLQLACDAAVRTIRSLTVTREQSRNLVRHENEAKVKFFGAMSHELRTPLNAILGYAGLLIEDAEERGETESVEDLTKIAVAGRRLLDLINNLLELSGIQSEKSVSVKTLASLRELLVEADAKAGEITEGAGSARFLLDSQNIMILADRDKTVRVLTILFSAAKAYSSASLGITTHTDMRKGEISIQIACPGWKMDADDANKLFTGPGTPFGELDDRSLVALALARSRARTLGGECTATTDDESMVHLQFVLPIGMTAHDADRFPRNDTGENAADDPTSGEAAARPGRRTVLVIDDDPSAIDLLRRWLQRLDCRVIHASNAYDGLELAKREIPDLILLDALMPGRSGYDMLAEMRASPNLRDLPVVLITVDDDRDRGLDAGASDFIRKPISEKQLREVVQTYDASAKGRILVVDDDEDAAEIMCRNLERIGFDAMRASDGERGLQAARKDVPSAIVLDLRMPNLDGFSFIERLAKDDVLASVPVIVVSGHDLSLPQHNLLTKAGYQFFSKGRTAPREIADTLRELVA